MGLWNGLYGEEARTHGYGGGMEMKTVQKRRKLLRKTQNAGAFLYWQVISERD